MSRYHHFAHLQDIALKKDSTVKLKAGDYVKRGELIGHCGNSGASTGPHLHYEVMKGKPGNWRQYVHGLTRDQVVAFYVNPLPFVRDGVPMANSLPRVGWGFLQRVYERNGSSYFHPGIDVNGHNDLGAEVYAPVNGRITFIEDAPVWMDKMNLTRKRMNGGWGRHIFIEQDEAKPGI